MVTELPREDWFRFVESGFQILPNLHLLGRLHGHDGSQGGVLDGQGLPATCEFDIDVTPLCGWGEPKQQSTGGWLSSFAVFEPHWQVTMADGRASGRISWQNTTYDFYDAPFYAEKNWGKALPSKWYWTQCNSFDGIYHQQQLSITAGGGIRQIPFGQKESLGMVCVHYNGTFYEATPWKGTMEWKVATWGEWILTGRSTQGGRPFEVEVSFSCDPDEVPGLVFRAPTPDEGMVYFCRDTFEAKTKLSLWELEWNAATQSFERKLPLIDGATSSQGGAEVGGGPWWDTWEQKSVVKQPIKALLQLPFRLQRLRSWLKDSSIELRSFSGDGIFFTTSPDECG